MPHRPKTPRRPSEGERLFAACRNRHRGLSLLEDTIETSSAFLDYAHEISTGSLGRGWDRRPAPTYVLGGRVERSARSWLLALAGRALELAARYGRDAQDVQSIEALARGVTAFHRHGDAQ